MFSAPLARQVNPVPIKLKIPIVVANKLFSPTTRYAVIENKRRTSKTI